MKLSQSKYEHLKTDYDHIGTRFSEQMNQENQQLKELKRTLDNKRESTKNAVKPENYKLLEKDN